MAPPGHRQGRLGAGACTWGRCRRERWPRSSSRRSRPPCPCAAARCASAAPTARRSGPRRARRRRWAWPPARAPGVGRPARSTTTPSASPRPTIEGRAEAVVERLHRPRWRRWPPAQRYEEAALARDRMSALEGAVQRTRPDARPPRPGPLRGHAGATSRGSSTGPASSTCASPARPAAPCPPPRPTRPTPAARCPARLADEALVLARKLPRPGSDAPLPAERDATPDDRRIRRRRRWRRRGRWPSSLTTPSGGSAATTTSSVGRIAQQARPSDRCPTTSRTTRPPPARWPAPDATGRAAAKRRSWCSRSAGRVAQRVDVAGGQRGDEQRGAPDVEHGVGERHRLAGSAPRDRCVDVVEPGHPGDTAGSTPGRTGTTRPAAVATMPP